MVGLIKERGNSIDEIVELFLFDRVRSICRERGIYLTECDKYLAQIEKIIETELLKEYCKWAKSHYEYELIPKYSRDYLLKIETK